MKHFRKIWTDELNEWLKTTKGMTPTEAYTLFLKTFPEITDVTRIAFCNQRSRMKAAGICRNLKFSRAKRPLYSEQVKKGYIRIKIAQPNVWVSKAKWVYMETHPWEDFSERSNYIFLDGDKRNFNPDNIERMPLALMGIFNLLGGCEKGNPELTRLRTLQAKLKFSILNRGEKTGLTVTYGRGRRFREEVNAAAKIRNARNRKKINEQERERMRKLKIENPEKWFLIQEKHKEYLRRKKNENLHCRKSDRA